MLAETRVLFFRPKIHVFESKSCFIRKYDPRKTYENEKLTFELTKAPSTAAVTVTMIT